jgi:cysteine desulfurase family protein
MREIESKPERSAGRIYLDNAATSYPKPACVIEAMTRYAEDLGASPGRGAYEEAQASGEMLWRCREAVLRIAHGGREVAKPERVIFTLNCSDALNLAIRGVVSAARRKHGRVPHVVTTSMDHNSVLRPLNELRARGEVEFTVVPADPETGIVDADDVLRAVRDDTALVAVVHASNVSGSIQPVGEIGAGLRGRRAAFLVDAAQTIGHIPIDMDALGVDLLAFPGHKGLLGPLGTGALVMRDGMEELLDTVREGGTGSKSEQDTQPTDLPDRFEPGSHNAIGIAGLLASCEWLLEPGRGVEGIAAHERALTERFLRGVEPILCDTFRLLGTRDANRRVGVFSFALEGTAPSVFAWRLEKECGVLARAGLHCAPLAHGTFGTRTHPLGDEYAGATRLSIGAFTTVKDVDRAVRAVEWCATSVVGVG